MLNDGLHHCQATKHWDYTEVFAPRLLLVATVEESGSSLVKPSASSQRHGVEDICVHYGRTHCKFDISLDILVEWTE